MQSRGRLCLAGARVAFRFAGLTFMTIVMLSESRANADSPAFEIRPFNIPESTLSAGLVTFANQAGVQLVVNAAEISGLRAHQVKGILSRDEALRRLIDGAPVTVRWTDLNTVAIRATRLMRTSLDVQAHSKESRPSAAVENSSSIGLNEILVTARKKGESDIAVPIAIKALGAVQIDRHGIQNLSDVAAITPSLNISTNFGSLGGALTLRGVGASAFNSATDQAVALNLDGVTVSSGAAVRFAQFDIERIEILQGPQSLYFGKNTSAGIISIISADPLDRPYAMLRTGYAFQAHGLLTEAVLSVPLADGLSTRVAFYRNDMKGYFRNPFASSTVVPSATQAALFGPLPPAKFARAPNSLDTGIRGTLKFEPSDIFSVRLKGSYVTQKGTASNAVSQLYYCPAGLPSPGNPGNVPGIGECRLDRRAVPLGQNATAAQGGDRLFQDGQPYQDNWQYLLVGNIDYNVTDGLTANSVTGYYNQQIKDSANATFSPYPGIGTANIVKRDDFTQEIRLSTNLDSPLNAMFGVYYQSGSFFNSIPLTILKAIVPRSDYYIDSRTYSAFGQLTYDLHNRAIEISVGGRYTDEKKDVRLYSHALNAFATDLGVNSVRSKRFTPEATVSWRPHQRFDVFVTYRRGTKSGGFSADPLNLPPFAGENISFADERVEGFEGGAKGVLFDGALRLDLTGYTYVYKDLQVGVFDPVTANQATRNAASAKIRGIQFATNYEPKQIRGFSLAAALNYSHARFGRYLATCYTGQPIAEGCNLDPSGNVVATGGTNQNLAGRSPIKAPDWTGRLSASYEFRVPASDAKLGLSAGAVYTGSFHTVGTQPPGSLQRRAVNLDAQVRLFNDDHGWELALVGKNLTNVLRIQQGVETPFTPGPAVASGTGTPGPGVKSDLVGFTNAPFELLLRLTIKPWDLFARSNRPL